MSQLKVNTIRHTGASSDAVTLASDGSCTVKATNNLSNRNLIINGAMQVAQRGVSSTIVGYGSVDRFRGSYGGENEDPTQAQITLTSSDTGPWAKGFTKAFQITNGNQTSGAGAADSCTIQYKMEGQDLANSGWDFTNPNSKITLSFWAKSSVAQTFYGRFRLYASSQYEYTYSIALSANTWTKVTKTLPGNSNFSSLVNTNALGLFHTIQIFYGTDFTGNKTLDTWAVKVSGTHSPNMDSDWWEANDATFAITGFQLEVGDVATEFEHRTFADELARCQRYYWKSYDYSVAPGTASDPGSIFGRNYHSTSKSQNPLDVRFPVPMRTIPTTLNGYAVHSGTIAKVSTDSSQASNCDVENALNAVNMLGERGFSSISTASIGTADFFGAHFTADAEL